MKPILLDEPFVVEAVSEKIYPIMWISHMVFDTPSPEDAGFMQLQYKPMSESGEVKSDTIQQISCAELFLSVQEVPEVAKAYAAILEAVPALKVWVDTRKLTAEEAKLKAEQEQIEAAQAQEEGE